MEITLSFDPKATAELDKLCKALGDTVTRDQAIGKGLALLHTLVEARAEAIAAGRPFKLMVADGAVMEELKF